MQNIINHLLTDAERTGDANAVVALLGGLLLALCDLRATVDFPDAAANYKTIIPKEITQAEAEEIYAACQRLVAVQKREAEAAANRALQSHLLRVFPEEDRIVDATVCVSAMIAHDILEAAVRQGLHVRFNAEVGLEVMIGLYEDRQHATSSDTDELARLNALYDALVKP